MSPNQIVELDLGLCPEAGTPLPIVMQCDSHTLLGFDAVRPNNHEGPRELNLQAILEFDSCLITKFGYPNDEALPGHPLYKQGMGYYGIFEVLESTWRAEIDQQNRVAFPDHAGYEARHFAITFHDSTFECLARDIRSQSLDQTDNHLIDIMSAQLRQ